MLGELLGEVAGWFIGEIVGEAIFEGLAWLVARIVKAFGVVLWWVLSLFAGFRMAFKSVGRSHVVLAVVPADRSDEALELARIAITGTGGGVGVAWAIDLAGFIAPGGG